MIGAVQNMLADLCGDRRAVLPVHCKAMHFKSRMCTGSSGSAAGRGKSKARGGAACSTTARGGNCCTAAAIAATLLLVPAVIACVAWYILSTVYEPQAALAAAAAEARAAAAAAATVREGRAAVVAAAAAVALEAPAGGSIDVAGLQVAKEDLVGQPGWLLDPLHYTVVIMSYAKRLRTLPLVINKLGSCPSAAEVLLVWNGDDPPSPGVFNSAAPLRIRQESHNDLSNRLRADGGIRTAAVYLADDDVLVRCADVERAFARWDANRQAIVGFFPRLVSPGPPPQYLGEKAVFQQGRYNALLTAGEFVSLDVLRLYWSERYRQGRQLVSQRTNCEDILLCFVAAEAARGQQHQGWKLQEQQGMDVPPDSSSAPDTSAAAAGLGAPLLDAHTGKGSEAAQGDAGPSLPLLPHVVWSQPSRRIDISFLSGVGLSRARASHEAARATCVAQFAAWYGDALQPPQPVKWGNSGAERKGRWLDRPLCSLPFLGCVYL